jgi:ComF family protein
MVYKWLDSIQPTLYPAVCALCGAPSPADLDLCRDCGLELPHNRDCCRRCALPLPASTGASVCGACHNRPPLYDRCLAPLLYRPPLDRLISAMKFHGQLRYGRLLGDLLGAFVQQLQPPAPQLIIPVPLHRARLRQRGYNQALEIARPLSRRLGIPLACGHLLRRHATAAQAELEKGERQRNVRGAFVLSRRLPVQHVALVDDVVTTGATVTELARVLRGAGVECVQVWAVARTP